MVSLVDVTSHPELKKALKVTSLDMDTIHQRIKYDWVQNKKEN